MPEFIAAVMPTTRSSRLASATSASPNTVRVLRRAGGLRVARRLLGRRRGAVDDRAGLGGVPLLHALEAALLGGHEALALHGLAVDDHRPVGLERLADRLAQRLHVVAVDHADVGEVELLEEQPRRPVGLERLLEDRPEALDPLADPGGQPGQRLLGVLARVVELGVEAHAVEVARQRAHVRRDRHAVVVDHDHDRQVQAAGVEQRLERHAAGERAVADHRHHAAVRAAAAPHGLLDAHRVGHRGRGVAGAHDVVLGLVDRAERGQAAVLADRVRAGRGGR